MSLLPWLDLDLPALHAPLPNAVLLIDPQRGNAAHLAHYWARKALCLREDAPCGQCKSCHLIAQGTHPDLTLHDAVCKVEEIRALNEQVQHTPSIGTRRLVVLGALDGYFASAVNALLKTLEEPPAHTHFILSAANRRAVKATVVSRCQVIQVAAPSVAAAEQWLVDTHAWTPAQAQPALALHQGNPFRALAMTEHPDPSASLEACVLFLQQPQHEMAYLLMVDALPNDAVLDTVCAQIAAIIACAQLGSADDYWQPQLAKHSKIIHTLDLHRLHRLYARLCSLRRADRQQVGKAVNIKHYLLEYAQQGAINL